jgi:hypothetical protein
VQWYTVSNCKMRAQQLSLAARGLHCANHPGNHYPFKEAVWGRGEGEASRMRYRFHRRILAPHILKGSVLRSPPAGIPGNKLATHGFPLPATFIYTIFILVWG